MPSADGALGTGQSIDSRDGGSPVGEALVSAASETFTNFIEAVERPQTYTGPSIEVLLEQAGTNLAQLPADSRLLFLRRVVDVVYNLKTPEHGRSENGLEALTRLSDILIGQEGVPSTFVACQRSAIDTLRSSDAAGFETFLEEISLDERHRIVDLGDRSEGASGWRDFRLAKGQALFHIIQRVNAQVEERDVGVDSFLAENRLHVARLSADDPMMAQALKALCTPEFYADSPEPEMVEVVSRLRADQKAVILEKTFEYVAINDVHFHPHQFHTLLQRVCASCESEGEEISQEDLARVAQSAFTRLTGERNPYPPLLECSQIEEERRWRGKVPNEAQAAYEEVRQEFVIYLYRALWEVVYRQEETQRDAAHVALYERLDLPRFLACFASTQIGTFFDKFEEAEQGGSRESWSLLQPEFEVCSPTEREWIVRSLQRELRSDNPEVDRSVHVDTLLHVAEGGYGTKFTELVADDAHQRLTEPDRLGKPLLSGVQADFIHMRLDREPTADSSKWCAYRHREAEHYLTLLDRASHQLEEASAARPEQREFLKAESDNPAASVLRPRAHEFLSFVEASGDVLEEAQFLELVGEFEEADYQMTLRQLIRRAELECVRYQYEKTEQAIRLIFERGNVSEEVAEQVFDIGMEILGDLVDHSSREQSARDALRERGEDTGDWEKHLEVRRQLLRVAMSATANAVATLHDPQKVSPLVDCVLEDWEVRHPDVREVSLAALATIADQLHGDELSDVLDAVDEMFGEIPDGTVWKGLEARREDAVQGDEPEEDDTLSLEVEWLVSAIRSSDNEAQADAFAEVEHHLGQVSGGAAIRFLEELGLAPGRDQDLFGLPGSHGPQPAAVNQVMGMYGNVVCDASSEELARVSVTELYRVCAEALEGDLAEEVDPEVFENALFSLAGLTDSELLWDETILGLEDLSRAISANDHDDASSAQNELVEIAAAHLAFQLCRLPKMKYGNLRTSLALGMFEIPDEHWGRIWPRLPDESRQGVVRGASRIFEEIQTQRSAFRFLEAVENEDPLGDLAVALTPRERPLAIEFVFRASLPEHCLPQAIRALYGESVGEDEDLSGEVALFLSRVEMLNHEGLEVDCDLAAALYGLRLAAERCDLDEDSEVLAFAAREVLSVLEAGPDSPLVAARAFEAAEVLVDSYSSSEWERLVDCVESSALAEDNELVARAGYGLLASIASYEEEVSPRALEEIVHTIEVHMTNRASGRAAISAFQWLRDHYRDVLTEDMRRRVAEALLS